MKSFVCDYRFHLCLKNRSVYIYIWRNIIMERLKQCGDLFRGIFSTLSPAYRRPTRSGPGAVRRLTFSSTSLAFSARNVNSRCWAATSCPANSCLVVTAARSLSSFSASSFSNASNSDLNFRWSYKKKKKKRPNDWLPFYAQLGGKVMCARVCRTRTYTGDARSVGGDAFSCCVKTHDMLDAAWRQ